MDETLIYLRVTEAKKINRQKKKKKENSQSGVRWNNLICIKTSCDTQTPFSNLEVTSYKINICCSPNSATVFSLLKQTFYWLNVI